MSERNSSYDKCHDNDLPKVDNVLSPSEEDSSTIVENSLLNENISNLSEGDGAKHKKPSIYKLFRIFFTIGFLIFSMLFINEVLIQPLRVKKSIDYTQDLYKPVTAVSVTEPPVAVTTTPIPTTVIKPDITLTPEQEGSVKEWELTRYPLGPGRDDRGRLKQFSELLKVNEDVKGWITIPDSNIDYVVMQSGYEDKEYYLNRDILKQVTKAGSLFLDYKSSVELPTQNMVIHGHNMTSTDNMFHYLMNYKELDYYKKRPVFTFDTIYQTGQWKIFSIFITNGTSKKEPLFNYTKADFTDASDFLNFVYQLRIRSIFQMDTVDINENDQLLTLSTCSYEVKDYRTVIVARRLRKGEDPTVDVESVTLNDAPLYPDSFYYRYGGKAPTFPETFEEALKSGLIKWYKAPEGQ